MFNLSFFFFFLGFEFSCASLKNTWTGTDDFSSRKFSQRRQSESLRQPLQLLWGFHGLHYLSVEVIQVIPRVAFDAQTARKTATTKVKIWTVSQNADFRKKLKEVVAQYVQNVKIDCIFYFSYFSFQESHLFWGGSALKQSVFNQKFENAFVFIH